ncbi:MAG: hypothetical protein U9Q73_01395 [Nanoarchaeota archaeon]|nr:hypothetical protein [Nanoarchaeota archaeon]
MAGLLTHLLVVGIGGLIITYFLKWQYGVAFGFGHLLPDLIDFGITGLFFWNFKPSIIVIQDWFYPLKVFGHNPLNWFIISGLLILTVYGFYKFKKISKVTMKILILATVFCLIGILIHLLMDVLIQEANHWI